MNCWLNCVVASVIVILFLFLHFKRILFSASFFSRRRQNSLCREFRDSHRRRTKLNRSVGNRWSVSFFPTSLCLSFLLIRFHWARAEIHIYYVVPWVDKPLSTLTAIARKKKSPPTTYIVRQPHIFILHSAGIRYKYTIMDYYELA